MFQQRFVDFARRNVFTALDDQFLDAVGDEGPGLPPDQLEKLFDPFYRVEASRNRDTGDTGLEALLVLPRLE